ncbi:MAG TPA: S9 family peptidase [Bryobacteraceae bacterium]|nr:S9 family peptidase [Bryobacteraceae bacterium]
MSTTIADTAIHPPLAKLVPKTVTVNGDTRVDNYFWLRDRDNPDTIQYLEAENRYTDAVMKPAEALTNQLYGEMLGRIKQTDLSVPTRRDDYFYYTRTEEGKQYSIYCRKHGSLKAPEEILLDGNAMAQGHTYFRIGNFSVSPNHRLLAYSVDFDGDEAYTIRVKDLSTGDLLADEIPNTYYSLEWGNDNATFFYTVLDAAKRPHKIFRHSLGVKEDALVYHETDERFTVELGKTSSRAYILIDIASPLTSEVRYVSADRPHDEFRTILPRVTGTEYDVTHHAESWFIRTNDHAPTFRVMEAPLSDPAAGREVLAARPEITVEDITTFRNYFIAEERDRGLTKIRIQNFTTGETHYIDFPDPVYTAGLGANAEYDTKVLRFVYTSLVTPPSVFDYDIETRKRELKKQQEVLGGYDPLQYASERVYATAPDGVKVPISLVYRKDFEKNGRAPALLYGYGAYGISMDPSFSSDRLSLLDRGFVWAIAHIRGGADLGKPWHEDGRLLHKKNTFTDFIAAAEYLEREKYTSPQRLAIMGGSAGGLLMGAVTNLRPDLFAAVVALVPFVDALNTMLDPSLPLTVGEYEEWGNPEDPQYYEYIKSYAPYENIAPKSYPNILVTAGLNDPRVSYWEPAKWVAKLRATKTGDRLLLLKTNMGSGHFGASGRYEHLKETAFHYAFILKALKIESPPC